MKSGLSEDKYPYMNESIEAGQSKIPLLYAGIRLDEKKKIQFNWDRNYFDSDVLRVAGEFSGDFDSDNVRYVYGYTFAPNTSDEDAKAVLDYIKGLDNSRELFGEEVFDFIDIGVLSIESAGCRFKDFDVVIHFRLPEGFTVFHQIGDFILEYGRCCRNHIYFEECEQSYTNAEFDSVKIADALQGVNVFIYDEFLKSDATYRKIARHLKSIHDKNTLTVFILIKDMDTKI